MREVITRFGRDNIGVLWLFLEPMIFTLGVATLWNAVGMNHGSSLPIIAFAVTGYSSVLLWRNCATRATAAIPANKGLLFHRNVRVIDILLTRSLLEIGGATGSLVILGIAFSLAGWMPFPRDPLLVVAGWVLLSWLGLCMALMLGSLSAFSDLAEKLWHPAAYLLFPLSGAAFMVDWLPRDFQEVVLLLPMVHGVEMLRDGYFGHIAKTHYDPAYLATSCAAMMLAGLFLTREAARRVEG